MNPKLNSAFSVVKARAAQSRLCSKIVFEDRLPKNISSVAGVDVAYTKEMSIGVVAVLDYDTLELVESQTARCKTSIPYVPTLLSFREIPPTIRSIRKLQTKPDVFLVDGQGYAHPRRCGFASHLGIVIDRPTIGVAKSKLIGEVDSVETCNVALMKDEGEVVGAVLRTKPRSQPIYVSVGHKVSLETAINIVKHCTRAHRIPEPVFKAHQIATDERRKIID